MYLCENLAYHGYMDEIVILTWLGLILIGAVLAITTDKTRY
jgi:hypothetical protein